MSRDTHWEAFVELSNYACESLNFSGVGVSGETPARLAEALARALEAWARANTGQHILQLTPLTLADAAGIVTLIVHTAGPELDGQLADEVAAAVEEALEMPAIVEPEN